MTLTSTFCRTQEASQRARATSAQLENVRTVAVTATIAWAREAALAEQREAKHGLEKSLPDAGSMSEVLDDQQFSENPDRGLTS